MERHPPHSMGEAGGGTGQSLRKIKPIYPAGQRITFILLERVSERKVWSPTGLYSLLHYLQVLLYPEIHLHFILLFCCFHTFPILCSSGRQMHHSRLAASPQNTNDVQSSYWGILPISCSEQQDDVKPVLLQCSCRDTAQRDHNLCAHDCRSANVCFASRTSSDVADMRRKVRIRSNNSLQIPPCDPQVSYASVSRTIRPAGHEQVSQQVASSPAPFGDSNDASFVEHAWMCLYNPAQWFISGFTITANQRGYPSNTLIQLHSFAYLHSHSDSEWWVTLT